ncbi:MAG: hypothetical protein GX455_01165 [Phycisphaerae bacterium]|nr:hypothetical protein [Phycisphaerae bacterium]
MSAIALSIKMGPDINFPKGYDSTKTKAILKVVQNEQYHFVDGVYSHWPPDWGTRLSFEGDVTKLNQFMAELHQIPGTTMRLILYRGRNDNLRQDSSWQLDYSQAHPDRLTLYLNVNSTNIDLYKIVFPEWTGSDKVSPPKEISEVLGRDDRCIRPEEGTEKNK